MEKNSVRFLVCSLILFLYSCGGTETVVTNYVHHDGSITRKIEIRSADNNFKSDNYQVPFDTTWKITDSLEISDKGDTTWVRRAVKTFLNADEINQSYRNDSGANKSFPRFVSLQKRFRWFNTEFRFAENLASIMEFGYPVSEFLNEEELTYFFSPYSRIEELNNGPDSLRYRAIGDSVNEKTEQWISRSLVAEWIGQFEKLAKGKDAGALVKKLRSDEKEIHDLIAGKYIDDFDSLWTAGIIQADIMGEENAAALRTEADSALKIISEMVLPDFSNYSVRIEMPGKLTGTNGFVDSSKILLWPVSSDLFLTRPYEMWAESKAPNTWAWVISVLFLLFVLTGVILKTIKKAD